MVTDQSGLGDHGFNDTAWEGVQRAARELDGEARVIESTEQAQYVPNLTRQAMDDVDLVIGVGFLLVDAMHEVALAHPEQKFALVDATVDVPNVQQLVFNEQEGSFLGGVIAGLTTATGKVGVVGGVEIPPGIRWICGFKAGVRSVRPEAQVLVGFAGSFGDPAKGKEIASAQYDRGADVIFEIAGATGIGAFRAAAERGPGVFVFGTDRCKFDLAPANALPDVVKRVDRAAYSAARAVAENRFRGGRITLGLEAGAIDLCERSVARLAPEIRATVEKARALILARNLTPPRTYAELAGFAPPKLLN
ncbi:MAG TPA: BMP family ABC transporter substrate-binding protein [Acidobacteriota bacterium]